MNNKISEISFFCPAYNDEGNLPILIPAVHKFLSEVSDRFEITIIEDGSPDNTYEVADKLAHDYSNIRVIHHQKNMGYGATLGEGFRGAKYQYVMYTDGDNQYDVNEFRPYISLLPKFDVLAGYATQKAVNMPRKIQSKVYNLMVNFLSWTNFKDINCSMKIFKKEVLDAIDIKSKSAFVDAELMVSAKNKGFLIKQFPVTHYERMAGIASGSKFNVVADTFKDMIKFRLGLL